MNVFDHDGNFGHMLGRTSRAMLNMLQKKFRQAGSDITVEQWTLLINIRNAGGQSQQQLAEMVYLDKTTIARLAAGL
ncbi:MAG: MarR family transcriptional regulator, partial [Deltaproteobacteria bacterium]|nr:MarR family transcriptional regulator [Deltaproteobacteria bacterium]